MRSSDSPEVHAAKESRQDVCSRHLEIPAKRESSGRSGWVDVSKACLVALVVLHHVVDACRETGMGLGYLAVIDGWLTLFRMPFFFLLAGLFAYKVVSGPPRTLWVERVGKFTYLTALWMSIDLATYALAAAILGKSPVDSLSRTLDRMISGVLPLWFIAALALFFALARVIRVLPKMLQVSMALFGASVLLIVHPAGLLGHLWLFCFFLIGLHYSRLIRAFAQRVRIESIGEGRMGRPLRWAGRHTLYVYLLHVPLLPLVLRLIPPGVAGALAGAAVLVLLSLALGWVLAALPGLFDLPKALVQGDKRTAIYRA